MLFLDYRFLRRAGATAWRQKPAVIAYGFDVLKLAEIAALVQTENTRSVRVLQKCGLTFRGMTPYNGRTVARYAVTQSIQAQIRP